MKNLELKKLMKVQKEHSFYFKNNALVLFEVIYQTKNKNQT